MVANYTQLLAKRYRGQLDSDADEFIEHAVSGVTRMQQLIVDLLSFSRVGTQGRAFEAVDCDVPLRHAVSDQTEAPQIHVSAHQVDGRWHFQMRDNGIGMVPDKTRRIFAMFQRLHTAAEYPGTGIGLAICKKIVERHGGTIWVDSVPGQGSTFSVLPE